jgi:hypothetical protein
MRSLRAMGGQIRFLEGQEFSLKSLNKGIDASAFCRHNNRTPSHPASRDSTWVFDSSTLQYQVIQ